MTNLVQQLKGWVCIVCTSIFLSSCSLLPAELLAGGNPPPTKLEIDNWNDNTGNWQAWDVNDPSNEAVTWSRSEGSIVVKFVASVDLNSFNGRAHTLSIKVIQLTNLAGFNSLVQTPEGIGQVLSQQLEMIPDAVISQAYTVAPNNILTFKLAREEDAKYIAVVTGFALPTKNLAVKIIPIPVKVVPQESVAEDKTLFDVVTFGLLMSKDDQPNAVTPSNIKMNIRLGETRIVQFSATAS